MSTVKILYILLVLIMYRTISFLEVPFPIYRFLPVFSPCSPDVPRRGYGPGRGGGRLGDGVVHAGGSTAGGRQRSSHLLP